MHSSSVLSTCSSSARRFARACAIVAAVLLHGGPAWAGEALVVGGSGPGAAGGAAAAPSEPESLIVLDIEDPAAELPAAARTALADALVGVVQRWDRVRPVSVDELRSAMRLEAERQTLGCMTATCAIELADAYGARWVVFSRIARVSTSWTLSLSLFDSQKAAIVGRGRARAKTLPAIHDVLADAVVDMMTPLGPPTQPVRVAAAPTTTRENHAPASSPSSADPLTAPFLSVDDVALDDEPLAPAQAAGCRYVDDADAWRCGEGKAAATAGVDVVVARTGSLTTAGVVNFAAELIEGCVVAVDVEIVAGDEPVRVDWRAVAATVDGVVVDVRRRGSGEAVVVPPRARARERLSAATDCLGARAVGPAGEVVTLDVAYAIGATPARALWVRERVHARVPEDELLVLVPKPDVPAAAAGTDAEPPGPLWTWAGVGAGLGIGAVAGSFVGVARMPASSSAGDRALVGSGWGAVAAVVVGVPAALAGVAVDGARYALWSHAHDADIAAARAVRARRAWERIPRSDVGGLGVSNVGAGR